MVSSLSRRIHAEIIVDVDGLTLGGFIGSSGMKILPCFLWSFLSCITTKNHQQYRSFQHQTEDARASTTVVSFRVRVERIGRIPLHSLRTINGTPLVVLFFLKRLIFLFVI